MAVLAECPFCHKKQAIRNKVCECGEDLSKAKKSKRVRFWISYRLPGGKQKREHVGFSIEKARDADGKRRSQKRENRIFDVKPDSKMTFNELTKWYLGLEKVKALARYSIMTINLNSFNAEFGNVVVSHLKPVDLENYQAKGKVAGYADAYIDQQIAVAKTMVNKAFDNDLISGDTLRVFKKVKKLLKRNGNARKVVISTDKFEDVLKKAPQHTRAILATAFYTGMRRGEILNLTWDKVDLKNRVIRLESKDTKDKEPRRIPICNALYAILNAIPRAIHDNHVFLYRGKPIRDLRQAMRRALKDAGIQYGRANKDGLVFHDLRHTFNTNMRKAEVPESVIMEITGHSTREMFLRYDTVDETDTKNAVDQFESYLKSVDQTLTNHPSKTQKVDPAKSQPFESVHGAEAGT